MFEPFIEFAKALIRFRHQYGNQTCGNHMIVINSMRYLHAELAQQNYNPVLLNTDHFIRAEKAAQKELSIRSARQLGVYLADIARTLNDNQLTKTKIYFQTSLPTSEANDRLSDSAKQRRIKLLPRKEVLHALAEISLNLKNNADRIRMNIIKILLFTGFRIGEALTLPVNTLVTEPQTDDAVEFDSERIGMRYWPEKGAEPRIKWLPTDASKLVKVAIEDLIDLTNDARETARWLEKNPTKLKTTISPETMFDMSQVSEFVGVKNGAFYCKSRNIPIVEALKSCGGHKKWYVQFKNLEQSILMQRWDKPMLRLPNGKNQKLSESLCVVFFEQLREYHPAIKWLVRPVSETNISNFICGAKSVKNVFERYGHLDDQGHPLQIRSHSFRHLLNTLANEGGLTDVELAWWFERKSIRDNEFYNHRTAEQLTEKARRLMLSGEIVGRLQM